MRRTCLIFLLGLLSPAAAWARPEPSLASRIGNVIEGPNYRQARWGILVVDAATGKSVYEHDADRLFIPASTTKLYSCSAALAALGPDYRFETPVYRRGSVKKGRLLGDLILVAKGDLTLGGRTDAHGRMAFSDSDHIYAGFGTSTRLTQTDPLAGLNDLARQIAAAGIHEISGDVLIDDRLFEHGWGTGSGPDRLTPILVNDNVVDLIVKPGAKPGTPASVHIRPETAYVQLDARVDTIAAGQKSRLRLNVPATGKIIVRGQITANSPPRIGIYAVGDPAGFARALFVEALQRHGVAVFASPLERPHAQLPEKNGYDRLTQVAKFTSPPLSEVIRVTLKVSHNLYASTLPLLIAAQHGGRTLADGLRWQRHFLAGLGVDVATISFAGGAGGANADSVTPRATVQLLRALMKRPDYRYIEAGLPVLGVDGTLADVVPARSPARGKVRAKTGTLDWDDVMNERVLLRSKAIAGVMTTATGRRLVFAMFVNDVPLPPGVHASREGRALGHLCEILYENVK